MSRRIVLVDIGSGLTLSGVLPSVALHGSYSAKLIARGGVAPYTFTTGSHLPDGLTLDGATGVLLADDVAEAGTFSLVVTVTDLIGASVTREFALQVVPQRMALTGTYPAGTIGTAYSADLDISGGTPPYSNPSIKVGSAPAGLSLSVVGKKLRLSGVPSIVSDSSDFTVSADSSDGQSASSEQSVEIVGVSDPYFSHVVSLTHFEGADGSSVVTDEIAGNSWVASVAAKLTTTTPLFGTSSLLAASSPLQGVHLMPTVSGIGTGDFSFEFSMRADSTPAGYSGIASLSNGTLGSNGFYIRYGSSGDIQVRNIDSIFISGVTPPPIGETTRVEFSRVSGVVYLFFNGVLQKSASLIGALGDGLTVWIGNPTGATTSFDGRIDEFRLTVGVGRHSSNYTPDVGAFPNS